MPNYNDADHVSISLKAVCEQSYPPLEVLVVDDGSTDNSVEIIKELAALYPCIRLLCNEMRQGVSHSVNRGVRVAAGKYIHVATANDLLLPGFFEKSMSILAKYPEAGLSLTDTKEVNKQDGSVNIHEHIWLPHEGYLCPSELVEAAHITMHPLCLGVSGIVIRRDLVLQNHSFISELGPLADWFLCQVVALRHGCCYVPEILAVINSSDNSYSRVIWNDHARFKKICTKLFQLLASSEYEDITSSVMQCRSLYILTPWGRAPSVVFNALCSLRNRNRYAHKLFWHLAQYYIYGLLPQWILSSPEVSRLLAKRSARQMSMIMQSIHDGYVTTVCYLQNIRDRGYARSFHEYHRIRTYIQRLLSCRPN
jgi:glycosyltransferase involved in cell wall biosynthesis